MGLQEAIALESDVAAAALAGGELDRAFAHYERMHVLSQRLTRWHVRSHVGMLRVGWRRSDAREVLGQCSRILAASLFSKLWVPPGNTGGANVSAFRPMPVPEDLAAILFPARDDAP